MNDRIRFDLNPPEMDYIFAHVAGETCKSGKYPERSWETDKKYTQMDHIRALKSHLYKYEIGVDIDPDSGLPTTEHLMWRAVAIAVNYMRQRVDDRPVALNKPFTAIEEIEYRLTPIENKYRQPTEGEVKYRWENNIVKPPEDAA